MTVTNNTNVTTNPYAEVQQAVPTTTVANANSSLDQDDFLKLLVAQLKAQTPDSPADTSQMMAQEAQFSQLNAMQAMAKQTTQMLNAGQSTLATSMLGKTITANGKNAGDGDITGVVTGVVLGTDGPTLKLGNTEVPLSSVKEVDPTKAS